MATSIYNNPSAIIITDDDDVVPAGSRSIAFTNTGSTNGTITMNEKTWTLIAGGTFNLPFIALNWYWGAATVDATDTVIECVYF
jgi:hypothetical protein